MHGVGNIRMQSNPTRHACMRVHMRVQEGDFAESTPALEEFLKNADTALADKQQAVASASSALEAARARREGIVTAQQQASAASRAAQGAPVFSCALDCPTHSAVQCASGHTNRVSLHCTLTAVASSDRTHSPPR